MIVTSSFTGKKGGPWGKGKKKSVYGAAPAAGAASSHFFFPSLFLSVSRILDILPSERDHAAALINGLDQLGPFFHGWNFSSSVRSPLFLSFCLGLRLMLVVRRKKRFCVLRVLQIFACAAVTKSRLFIIIIIARGSAKKGKCETARKRAMKKSRKKEGWRAQMCNAMRFSGREKFQVT